MVYRLSIYYYRFFAYILLLMRPYQKTKHSMQIRENKNQSRTVLDLKHQKQLQHSSKIVRRNWIGKI